MPTMYKDKLDVAKALGVPVSEVMSAKEAARKRDCGVTCVYSLAKRGELKRFETCDYAVFVEPDLICDEVEKGGNEEEDVHVAPTTEDIDDLRAELAGAESYIDQLEEQLEKGGDHTELQERYSLERQRRQELEKQNEMLKASLDTADGRLAEAKSDLKKARAELHQQNNQLAAAIGTLWVEFCEGGPIQEDALNGVTISEAVSICTDTYLDTREDRDRLRERLESDPVESARRYLRKKERSSSATRLLLGGIRAVASKFINR